MQDEIDRQFGLPQTDTGQDCASSLLRALTRMQEILLHNANNEEDGNEPGRPILREANTLIEVFDSLLDLQQQRFPQETLDDLRASRNRLLNIRERLENNPPEDLFQSNIDQMLAREIHGKVHA